MNSRNRRILQAVLYEAFAIALVSPMLNLVFDQSAASSIGLAVALSTIALCWNYVFNTIFERWESRQVEQGRSLSRRLLHGLGFEGGLVVLLIPIMSMWLNISIVNAFLANLSLLVFFFFYAIVFTWAFDRFFGLPESAVKAPSAKLSAPLTVKR